MATTSTRKTGGKSSNVKNANVKSSKEVNSVTEEINKDVIETSNNEVKEGKVREFSDRDLIPCVNVFPGYLGMTGRRSGNVYMWEAMGAVEHVEYQDLRSEILNKKSPYVYEPLFIVNDDDFLAKHKELANLYNRFYTPEEIVDKITNLTPEKMELFITSLPSGIKNSVKNIAATMIQEGTLDSVKKINKLDEIFGTKLGLYLQ